MDGVGCVVGCGVIGCWRWGIIAIVEVDLRRFSMCEAREFSFFEKRLKNTFERQKWPNQKLKTFFHRYFWPTFRRASIANPYMKIKRKT